MPLPKLSILLRSAWIMECSGSRAGYPMLWSIYTTLQGCLGKFKPFLERYPRSIIGHRWATIATVTMALRLCLLRPLIESNKHNVRFAAVAPELRECQEQIKRATDTGDVQGRQIAVKHFQQVLVNNDVNPLRSLKLPIIQIPIFMVMFFALRRLAENPFPQFIEGGFSWVTDLTVPDPFYILPVTSMLFQNLVLRVSDIRPSKDVI